MAAPSPPRRQSCDRCHGQKLRCTRASNNDTGTCIRCLRQRARCTYSLSLPKGRPSMYRCADPLSPSPTPTPAPAPASAPTPRLPATRPSRAKLGLRGREGSSAAQSYETVGFNTDSNTGAGACMNILESPDREVAPYANSTSPEAHCRFDLGFGQSVGEPPNLTDISTTASCFWQTNWHGLVAQTQSEKANLAIDMFDMMGGQQLDSRSASGSSEIHPALQLPCGLDMDYSCLGGDLVQKVTVSGLDDMVPAQRRPDVTLLQLSEFSQRLSALHRQSQSPTAAAGAGSAESSSWQPFLDHASFKSLALWLVSVSAGMATPGVDSAGIIQPEQPPLTDNRLYNIFSASYQFIQMLGGPPAAHQSGSATSSSTSALSSLWQPQRDLTSDTTRQSTACQNDQGLSLGVAERHLTLACHSLLLESYLDLIALLQQDVDRHPSFLVSGNTKVEHELPMGVSLVQAQLNSMPLVLIAQVCSYLIDCQSQSVSAYLQHAANGETVPMQQMELSGFSLDSSGQGGLEVTVKHRLGRLRESLRM